MTEQTISVEPLSEAAIAPYGWMLGKPLPAGTDAVAYGSVASDFWHEHGFDVGPGGEHEILWVKYRSTDPVVERLEAHSLTQQAVIPLVGQIIQIVAAATAEGLPDPSTVRAFALSPGYGICMRPGIWHATRARAGEATCLMLTRRSTTADLVRHLNTGSAATESRFADLPGLRLAR